MKLSQREVLEGENNTKRYISNLPIARLLVESIDTIVILMIISRSRFYHLQ